MSVKLSSSDILAQFPIAPADMPKIASTDRPNYTTITKFREALAGQALAIPSSQTTLGHLALIISTAEFETVNNNVAYVTPVDPGASLTVAPAATAAQTKEATRLHDIATNNYQVYVNTRTHLRNQIINSVPDKYISVLKHHLTHYSNRSPLELLMHLTTTYGTVTSDDLTANYAQMTAQWNPPAPIESLWEQLKEGKEFSTEGQETLSDAQLMRLAYDNIKNTGIFTEECRLWRQKPAAAKTYGALKTYFIACDTDRRQNITTSGTAGYSANAVRELVQNELASVIADQPPLDAGTPPTEEDLSQFMCPPTESANAVTLEDMKTLFQSMLNEHSPRTTGNHRQTLVAQGNDADGTRITYCWSHGITRNLKHNSKDCKRKKEGHKDDATLTNKMGGCTERCKARSPVTGAGRSS